MKSLTRGRNSDNPPLLDLVLRNNDDLIDVSLLPPLGKSDQHKCFFQCFFSRKDPHLSAVEFTDVNDQLSYFVKTLNMTKESFIPRKKCFINSRNRIKLDKTAQSKLRKKQRLWKQYLKTMDTKTYTDFKGELAIN